MNGYFSSTNNPFFSDEIIFTIMVINFHICRCYLHSFFFNTNTRIKKAANLAAFLKFIDVKNFNYSLVTFTILEWVTAPLESCCDILTNKLESLEILVSFELFLAHAAKIPITAISITILSFLDLNVGINKSIARLNPDSAIESPTVS